MFKAAAARTHPAVPRAEASIPFAWRYVFHSGWDCIAALTAARSVVFKVIIGVPFLRRGWCRSVCGSATILQGWQMLSIPFDNLFYLFFAALSGDLSACPAICQRDLSACQPVTRPRPRPRPRERVPWPKTGLPSSFVLRPPTPLIWPPSRTHTRILRFCTYDYHFVKYPKTGPYWKRASLHRPPFSYKRGQESQYPPIL